MTSELKGFRHVVGGNGGGALQVGQGARHPKDTIVPAGGKTESFHGLAQELRPSGIRRRDLSQDPR
jgi:hypothetical protein